MTTFSYRPWTERGALNLNECTIGPVVGGWWQLHFYVRCNDGHEQMFRVPVNPNGSPVEDGPGGRTWGLTRCGPGEWQIAPSINFDPDWHQTPKIVGVPEREPWMRAG
ncbi:MAG: hypothetical protein Q6370_010640 [Candidatus Sigynarchaeota archaeon]